MSLFRWFSKKKQGLAPAAESSGLGHIDATLPFNHSGKSRSKGPHSVPGSAANRKNERLERRELLYTVVRESMTRAGLLSTSYKFKVLSLDQRGRQFLVMMDLAREYGGETVRLSEIEALIAQTAKTRYDILVTAVYWRINDHVAVGIPQKGVAPQGASLQAAPPLARRPVPVATAPAPVVATPARPVAPVPTAAATAPAPLRPPLAAPAVAPAAAPTAPAAAPRPAPRYEPIEADEVAAFKRALASAAGTTAAVPLAAAKPGVPVRSGPLLPPSQPTGFEDTEMPGSDGPAPDLSSTQYGELN